MFLFHVVMTFCLCVCVFCVSTACVHVIPQSPSLFELSHRGFIFIHPSLTGHRCQRLPLSIYKDASRCWKFTEKQLNYWQITDDDNRGSCLLTDKCLLSAVDRENELNEQDRRQNGRGCTCKWKLPSLCMWLYSSKNTGPVHLRVTLCGLIKFSLCR